MATKEANVCVHKVDLDQFNCESCRVEAESATKTGKTPGAPAELPAITLRAAIELFEKMPLNPKGQAAVKLLVEKAAETTSLEDHQRTDLIKSFVDRTKFRIEAWGKDHGIAMDELLTAIDELAEKSQ